MHVSLVLWKEKINFLPLPLTTSVSVYVLYRSYVDLHMSKVSATLGASLWAGLPLSGWEGAFSAISMTAWRMLSVCCGVHSFREAWKMNHLLFSQSWSDFRILSPGHKVSAQMNSTWRGKSGHPVTTGVASPCPALLLCALCQLYSLDCHTHKETGVPKVW